ncbi:VTT domain-containing protein [Limosilactobacillus fermentum]|nr:VTT domain-containing protein [Limosilactobacillus fermentum]
MVNWAGNILGNCAVAALLSHVKLSHKFKQNKILDSLTHYRHPALGLTVGYMVPIIPSVLVNYACATMKIPHKNFILMVAVGMFPTSALYAFGRRLV